MDKSAKAEVDPLRQRTQYTCVATSVMMALNALGKDLTEEQVNRILGAEPKKGARWEEAIATLQYFGCRGTLTAPSTLSQIKEWTDEGQPVLIAWNPEGRPWSHASCVFHVEQGPPKEVPPEAQLQGTEKGTYVWVADPNIPNPSKTYRIVHEQEFYEKWGEDWGDFIVRRPALMVSLEITPEGKQVMASKTAGRRGKRPQQNVPKKDRNGPMRIKIDPTKSPGKDPFSNTEKHRRNDGAHGSKKDYRRKPKHPKPYGREAEGDPSTLGTAELQSSFYKTLDGEALQVTPLRSMPDYGERQMMDINEMLEKLEQEENLTLNASQMAETLKTAATRPAGGLYGHTKAVQRDVLNSVKRVQKAATKIARTIYAKDKNTFNFLHLHADRSNSLSARILCAAMENIGPKVASSIEERFAKENWAKRDQRLMEEAYALGIKAKEAGEPSVPARSKMWNAWMKKNNRKMGDIGSIYVLAYDKGYNGKRIPKSWKDTMIKGIMASTKTAAGHGMYGYRVKTAKLALQACIDISQEAGSVAYDLHTRRTAKYAKITAFLKDHSKRGRCRYARILLRFYPEMGNLVTAADDEKDAEDEKEAKHEKGKSVPLSKMPKKLQDNAKDESKHLKSARLMKRQEKVLEKWLADGGQGPLGRVTNFDELPTKVQKALRRIKDSEMLWADVERWISDNDNPHLRSMWAIERAKELLKAAGCENLPNEAMQKACEAKKKDGDKEEDDKEDKTAGCEKLPPALKENCEKKKDDAKDSDEDDSKTAGCENLPNEAMQEACEAKKKDGDKAEGDDKEAGLFGNPITDAIKDGLNPKKACACDGGCSICTCSRVRLTTRVANGELQRGEVRFAVDVHNEIEDEDQKEGESMGRSQLPGEEQSNENQPKIKGESGYNPGGTEFNGYGKGKGKEAAEADELAAKAEGHSELPNDEESDKVQPDMNQHGFDAGETAKLANAYETVTSVTDLPDGAKLYWVD